MSTGTVSTPVCQQESSAAWGPWSLVKTEVNLNHQMAVWAPVCPYSDPFVILLREPCLDTLRAGTGLYQTGKEGRHGITPVHSLGVFKCRPRDFSQQDPIRVPALFYLTLGLVGVKPTCDLTGRSHLGSPYL